MGLPQAHDGPAPTRQELSIDAALALVVFAGSLALLFAGAAEADADGVDAVGVGLAALASLPLAARRFEPLAVFVLTALASIALNGFAEPAGPPLGPTLALYFVAAAGRRPTWLVLGLVLVLLAAHAAANGLASDAFPGPELLFGVLVWGGAWLAGDRTRLRQERMAALEERARRLERDAERERRLAAAEERTRIARDLHDSAGHAINVILVHAGLGRLRSEKDPGSAGSEFATIEQVARETVGEIDTLVGALRDDGDRVGSDSVEPPAGLAALDSLVARHRATGLDVTTSVDGERVALAPGVDRGAFRILQEALTNAARHGGGSVRVNLRFRPDALELTIANPLARDRAGPRDGGGHGVAGMRERAALLGGTLEAGARNGEYLVRARLPIAGET